MNSWSQDSSGRSWPATAYQKELPEGRVHGRISVEGSDLVFRAGDMPPRRLPLDAMDVRFGGFNNQQAFLSHASLPDWTFLCADPEFLKDEAMRQHPVHGRNARRKARESRKWGWPVKAALTLMVLCIGGIVALWMARDAITGWIANAVPVSAEKQLGEQVWQEFKMTSRVSSNAAVRARLDAITARLLPAVKDSPYAFQFHIVENDMVNAFALPGGNVIVFTGLIEKAKTPEEIAGVLAHEIAHITHRHSLRAMVSSLGTMVVVKAVFGDYSGLAEAGSVLLRQSYGRDAEREADETGWKYLLAAEIDPEGMISFFRTIMAEEEKAGVKMEGAMSLLSTHPATKERIATLEAKRRAIPADRKFRPIDLPAELSDGHEARQ